jgi:hypothetical protein
MRVKRGVIALAGLQLMVIAVHAAIKTVHIVEERGAEHGVIERGVEECALIETWVWTGALDLDLPELILP